MYPDFLIEFCLWLLAAGLASLLKNESFSRAGEFYLLFILTGHSFVYAILLFTVLKGIGAVMTRVSEAIKDIAVPEAVGALGRR
ncbi:hypothetical protein IJT93_13250 [bacterium]|nr:hypothetical protein [bacterium]